MTGATCSTTRGEDEGNKPGRGCDTLLWDVIAAKGFEKDTYFEMAARDIRALPRLEGTVHVNIALIVKFMTNYFFNPGQFPESQDHAHPFRRLPVQPGPAGLARSGSTTTDPSSTGSTSPTSHFRSRLRS